MSPKYMRNERILQFYAIMQVNLGVCQENPSTVAGTIRSREQLQQYEENITVVVFWRCTKLLFSKSRLLKISLFFSDHGYSIQQYQHQVMPVIILWLKICLLTTYPLHGPVNDSNECHFFHLSLIL